MIAKTTNFLIVHMAILIPAFIALALLVSRTARSLASATLRFAARPMLLLAVVALVYDGTRTIAGGSGIVLTSLIEHWSNLAPNSLATAQALFTRMGQQAIWDTGVLKVLRLPAWLIFGTVGVLLAYIGRKREHAKVFVN